MHLIQWNDYPYSIHALEATSAGELNITGPSDRFGSPEIKAAIPKLQDAASRIMEQLGYHGPAT